MSLNLNKVVLAGRMVENPEIRTTQSGLSVTQFRIAVNKRGAKDSQEQQADFLTVVAWRQTAEFITKFFKKGNAICVTGSIQTRSYTDKENQKRTATEILADEAYFVESKAESNPQYAPPAWNTPQTAQNPAQTYYTQQAYTNAPAQQMPLQGNTESQTAHETSDAFSSEEELPF